MTVTVLERVKEPSLLSRLKLSQLSREDERYHVRNPVRKIEVVRVSNSLIGYHTRFNKLWILFLQIDSSAPGASLAVQWHDLR